MQFTSVLKSRRITHEQLFMLSVILVNGGNYLYNLILGRILGPAEFADAAILITFLSVLSFIAMTFQLVTAKFSVLFEGSLFNGFISKIFKNAFAVGLVLGIIIIAFANQLQELFRTSSSEMFVVFGIGVPIYFLMSVNRGIYQGHQSYKWLSMTYQAEMLSRLLITLGLLFVLNINSSLIISIGILISFGFGLVPFEWRHLKLKTPFTLNNTQLKQVKRFFIITAFYECTQIVINNSDILLVKHYFESYEAGLYASLALIGRVVYFIAWMFVMLLLPKVVQLKKEGKETSTVLFKYVLYILAIALAIVIGCACFPELAIQLLFGEDYLSMAPLLWKYATATGLFAVSNIFAYYYLSLDRYVPVIISGLFGLLQVALVVLFHTSLEEVVLVQIAVMVLLLLVQVAYFIIDSRRSESHI